MKAKVDDPEVVKLKTVPIDLKKLSDVVQKEVVQNTTLNPLKTKESKFDQKIPNATTLIHTNRYNTDKQNLEKKMEMSIKKYLMLMV